MTEVLNSEQLDELERELSAADVVNLLHLFLETTPGLVTSLADAVAGSDAETVTRAAHRLKGGCVSIGATALASVAREIEEDVAAASSRAPQLTDTWQRTAEALRARIALQG